MILDDIINKNINKILNGDFRLLLQLNLCLNLWLVISNYFPRILSQLLSQSFINGWSSLLFTFKVLCFTKTKIRMTINFKLLSEWVIEFIKIRSKPLLCINMLNEQRIIDIDWLILILESSFRIIMFNAPHIFSWISITDQNNFLLLADFALFCRSNMSWIQG